MSIAPRVLPAALVLVAVALLTACSSGDSGGTGTSLAATKSSLQLLRNEAADRFPVDLVTEVIVTDEGSIACRSASEDPDGLERAWNSLVDLRLALGTDPAAEVETVVASFVAEGWTRADAGGAITVTRPGDAGDIVFTITEPNAASGIPGQVQLSLTGPCVLTAGENSDEVRLLEQ